MSKPIDDTFHPPFQDGEFTYHVKKNPAMDKIFSPMRTPAPPIPQVKLVVFLDFDGTVVEHEFPKIGRQVFGCEKVIAKLRAKEYRIVLNTMRSDFREDANFKSALQQALDFLAMREIDIDMVASNKVGPYAWKMDHKVVMHPHGKEQQCIYIDDQAANIPLKPAVMTAGNVVDWDQVEKDLTEAGIL